MKKSTEEKWSTFFDYFVMLAITVIIIGGVYLSVR